MRKLLIPLPPGFNFIATVESHGWYRLAPLSWDRNTQTLVTTEVFEQAAVGLTIRCSGESLAITAASDAKLPSRELRDRMRRMFQLDVGLEDFHRRCAKSARYRRVLAAGYGRLLCGSTLFEDIVKIIATTNVTWSQTVRMVSLLAEKCGRKTDSGHHAFPAPEDISRRSAGWLQTHCRLGYRAAFIHQLARGIVSGEIDLPGMADPGQTTEELFRSYRQLPGIGPYGAAHLLAMDGRHDFIAVDTEFRRFVRDRYFASDENIGDIELVSRYQKWGRWKYLAYWSELWESSRVADSSGVAKDQ